MEPGDSLNPDGLPAADVPSSGPRTGVLSILLTWLVILGLIAASVLARELIEEDRQPGENVLELRLMRFQARYFVGAQDLLKQQSLYEAARPLRRGGVTQRLRFAILAGELAGSQTALDELHLLDQDMQRAHRQYSPEEQRLRDILGRLYRDHADLKLQGPSVTPEQRAFLRKKLDWFGELALAPPELNLPTTGLGAGAGTALALVMQKSQPANAQDRQAILLSARQTATYLLATVTIGVLLGLAGLVGLIILCVLAANGNVTSRVDAGTGHGPIYGEAFAVFLLLFATLPLLPWPFSSLVRSGIVALIGLTVALAWPIFRGVSWTQLRHDIGLTTGRGLLVEALFGVAGYIMTLPLAAAGMIVTVILMQLRANLAGEPDIFAPSEYPSHPLAEYFMHADFFEQLAIVFLAAGLAPFVEEIVFRGLLYQHVREASRRLWTFVSILLSAAVVSFLFAVIHPQGLLAVPALMGLAFGFALVREWRGTLLPCMVGHGLNNGLITAALFFLMMD